MILLPEYGFWSMAHESRTDWALLLGSLFLLVVGAGRRASSGRLARGEPRTASSPPGE